MTVRRDGTVSATALRYTIDSREAQVDVDSKTNESGVDLRVQSDEPVLEVCARQPKTFLSGRSR